MQAIGAKRDEKNANKNVRINTSIFKNKKDKVSTTSAVHPL